VIRQLNVSSRLAGGSAGCCGCARRLRRGPRLEAAATEVSAAALANYDGTVASYRQATLDAFQQVEDNLATLRILEQEACSGPGAGIPPALHQSLERRRRYLPSGHHRSDGSSRQ
jgi:hypothetical protein